MKITSIDRQASGPNEQADEGLYETVTAAVGRARAEGTTRVVATGIELKALNLFVAFEGFSQSERFFWAQPARRIGLAAEGAVRCIETRGPDRIRSAERELKRQMSQVHCVDSQTRAALRWVGGFAYSPEHRATGEWTRFPAGQLLLPELLLWQSQGRMGAVVARRVEPHEQVEEVMSGLEAALLRARHYEAPPEPQTDWPTSLEGAGSEPEAPGAEYCVRADRSHSAYRRQVAGALGAIARGAFEKVVLARSLEVRHPGRLATNGFLESLCEVYPSCTIMAAGHGEHTLVSASPEFLVSLEGEVVRTQALAGSARRGSSPDQDERIGRSLEESKKEQSEHAAVVRALRTALAEVCHGVRGPESPELLKLEGIQHLSTPITGLLRTTSSAPGVLELVDLLHPTPAVSGFPKEAAVAWIREHEGLERGWYAGPMGWVAADGSGEFWLALRMALILHADAAGADSMTRARLFAGAGIVEGSLPESELVETRLKLRALLAPLTEI